MPEPETIASATANDTKGVDLDALVRIVRDHWQAHSTGPTWAEVAHGLGVPQRKAGAAIRVLAGHGVLTGLGRHRQLALSSPSDPTCTRLVPSTRVDISGEFRSRRARPRQRAPHAGWPR